MNTLVIYDSKFGNTEQIAQAIAEVLQAHGLVRLVPVAEAETVTLDGVDLLAAGGPTQAHGISPALTAWLANLPRDAAQGLPTVTFDTRFRKPAWLTGSAAHSLAKRLEQHDCHMLVPPESFFVAGSEGPLEDGERDRAIAWAHDIAARMPVAAPA
ncbi:MAG TPA: flavodoxin family protein [Chloroflexia bacterium]|jgi:flavodoxin|nr:flavodoxin family protein [Chloroflexia bacterium]